MGKGNRIKSQKAQVTLAAPVRRPVKDKKPMPTWVGTLILVAVLTVLILFAAINVLNSRGTFMRMYTIAETDHFEVTAPMMSYMVYTEYQNLLSNYDQFAESYGTTIAIGGGTNGNALDRSAPLRDQIYSKVTDANGNEVVTTWFDHFAGLAAEDVKQILACCEIAHRHGIALDEADKDSVEANLVQMTAYAAYYGYSTSGYLASMYGKGVLAKDVRAMMELSALANKYNTIRSEEIRASITDDRVKAYYEEHQLDYDTYIDYLGYTFTATFTPVTGSEDSASQNAILNSEYEEKKTLYKQYAAQLEACKTADDYTSTLMQILREIILEEEKEKKLKELGKDTLTAEEIAACENNAAVRVLETMDKSTFKNYKSTDKTSDLEKWLFDTDTPRKANEVKKFETEVKASTEKSDGTVSYEKATSTYSVYITQSALHRDESVVRSAGHILFKTDTYKDKTNTDGLTGVVKTLAQRVLDGGAEKLTTSLMAAELLKLMNEEGKITSNTKDGKTYYTIDKEVFEEYGLQYTEDANVFYADVQVGEMVASFEDWLFDGVREIGEISYPAGVDSDYGTHIMMYTGDEKPAWSYNIRNEMGEKEYEAWLEVAVKENATAFTNSSRAWNMITG